MKDSSFPFQRLVADQKRPIQTLGPSSFLLDFSGQLLKDTNVVTGKRLCSSPQSRWGAAVQLGGRVRYAAKAAAQSQRLVGLFGGLLSFGFVLAA